VDAELNFLKPEVAEITVEIEGIDAHLCASGRKRSLFLAGGIPLPVEPWMGHPFNNFLVDPRAGLGGTLVGA